MFFNWGKKKSEPEEQSKQPEVKILYEQLLGDQNILLGRLSRATSDNEWLRQNNKDLQIRLSNLAEEMMILRKEFGSLRLQVMPVLRLLEFLDVWRASKEQNIVEE